MVDSPDSVDAGELPTDATDASRFPAAKFVSAIAMLVGGGVLMLVYIVFRGMSHSFSSRKDDPWWWAGIAFQVFAGWRFLGVASDASDIPTTQRSGFVLPGIIVSYVLAAAIVLFNAWAVATILNLL